MNHDGWFWLVKANKTSTFLVNYSHQKVLLESKLILCHGSELRQNQEVVLDKASRARISINWRYVQGYGHQGGDP